MDYPSRKRRPKSKRSDADAGLDRRELKLAEYAAPFGEETPWRATAGNLPEFADAWREWKPDRGRLH